jgi:hypothetical protein
LGSCFACRKYYLTENAYAPVSRFPEAKASFQRQKQSKDESHHRCLWQKLSFEKQKVPNHLIFGKQSTLYYTFFRLFVKAFRTSFSQKMQNPIQFH